MFYRKNILKIELNSYKKRDITYINVLSRFSILLYSLVTVHSYFKNYFFLYHSFSFYVQKNFCLGFRLLSRFHHANLSTYAWSHHKYSCISQVNHRPRSLLPVQNPFSLLPSFLLLYCYLLQRVLLRS